MKVAAITKYRNGVLIEFRAERNLSQADAAAIAGVPLRAWSTLERMDFRDTTVSNIAKIAACLDTTIDELCPPECRNAKLGFTRTLIKAVEWEQMLLRSRPVHQLPATAALDHKELVTAIRKAMAKMSDRQRTVLAGRYGLNGAPPLTLSELAKVIGVTRERVRQIEAEAIRRLQHPDVAGELDEFLENMGDEAEQGMELFA